MNFTLTFDLDDDDIIKSWGALADACAELVTAHGGADYQLMIVDDAGRDRIYKKAGFS